MGAQGRAYVHERRIRASPARKLREADQAAPALVCQREQVDRLATESRTPLSDRTASAPRHLAAGDGDVSAGAPRRRAGRIAPADGWADEVDFGAEIPVLRRVLEDGPRRPLADRASRAQAENESASGRRVRPSPG